METKMYENMNILHTHTHTHTSGSSSRKIEIINDKSKEKYVKNDIYTNQAKEVSL